MKQHVQCVFVTSLLALVGSATSAWAGVISEFTGGPASATTLFSGQSLTTPSNGPWDNLSFSFFSDTSGGTTPSAAGTLFLLSGAYAGLPSDLSSSTAGFIAQSQSIVGDVYFFDASVTIQPGTVYFFYTDASLPVSGANSDEFPGGNAFLTSSAGSPYAPFVGDANFRLSGSTATPEPDTFALIGCGVGVVWLFCRRQRPVKS